MSKFVVWMNEVGDYDCVLTDFEGLDNTFPLLAGTPLQETFPADARFSMNPDLPNNMLTPDSVQNTNMVIVASERLAGFFREQKVPYVEYLPVTIFDHKGKPIDGEFQIIHPVEPVDGLDLTDCEVEYSFILPDQIESLRPLKLKEDDIPEDRVFFRCRGFADRIFVRRSLAEAITQAGFTGIKWRELVDCR